MIRQRRGYRHWFSTIKLPEPITDERCLELYRALLTTRSPGLRREVIQGHIRYGTAIVSEFVVWAPNKSDDLVSEMCEALVDGVDNIIDGAIQHHEVPNITGYLVAVIRGRLKNFVMRDGLFKPSEKTVQELKKRGLKPPTVDFSLNGELVDESTVTSTLTKTVEELDLTPQQEQVLKLRLEGHDDREIAPMLGFSFQWISQIRRTIGAKFLETFNGRTE